MFYSHYNNVLKSFQLIFIQHKNYGNTPLLRFWISLPLKCTRELEKSRYFWWYKKKKVFYSGIFFVSLTREWLLCSFLRVQRSPSPTLKFCSVQHFRGQVPPPTFLGVRPMIQDPSKNNRRIINQNIIMYNIQTLSCKSICLCVIPRFLN